MLQLKKNSLNQFQSHCVLFDSTGVIEVLVNSGRQIDAVNLAFAFELTEHFSPVALLKSYLKEARKVSSPAKPGNTSPTGGVQVQPLSAKLKIVVFIWSFLI